EREPDVNLRYVGHGEGIGDADVIIIPGSKNTIDDLNYLYNCGYAGEILRHYKKGGSVVGICGGYQMLGEYIADPYRVETSLGKISGMGLLPVSTTIEKEKVTSQVCAKIHPLNRFFKNTGEVKGYEIHMGLTGFQEERHMFEIIERDGSAISVPDGFISEDGRVWGTYIHGIFDNDGFREEFISRIKAAKGLPVAARSESEADASFNFQEFKEVQYDRLAALVRRNTDMETFYRIAGLR
ncbi:MAG: cobyric acid synthase CobQ, partial [Deltaproteobacteria bacterium CG_4_8_14_3_um_filter_43_13]